VIRQVCKDCNESIFAVHNFANENVTFEIPEAIELPLTDLITREEVCADRQVTLEPYQVAWLKGPVS
jgi:hypothetical protein